jgi:hypothetical protein
VLAQLASLTGLRHLSLRNCMVPGSTAFAITLKPLQLLQSLDSSGVHSGDDMGELTLCYRVVRMVAPRHLGIAEVPSNLHLAFQTPASRFSALQSLDFSSRSMCVGELTVQSSSQPCS